MKTRLPYVGLALVMLLAGMLVDRLASAQPAATTSNETSTTTTTTTASAPRFKSMGGWVIPARKAAEQSVTESTKRYGFEVYQDTANGNLIYMTETGSIAVVPPTK